MVPKQNLWQDTVPPATGERFDALVRCRNVTIERILSSDRPDSQPYDQPQDEWVLLLQGEAHLEIGAEEVMLRAGDYLFLPARTPHRILATSSHPPCLWLAVHIHPESE